jgi:hypothetical protein
MTETTLPCTAADLLRLIGQLHVANALLREQNALLLAQLEAMTKTDREPARGAA